MILIEGYKLEIIESLLILVLFIILRFSIRKVVDRIASKHIYQKSRVKIIKKLINVLLFFISFGTFLFIWGIDRSQLVIFISSVLTILGIAFFAQWSILSNITSTLIIFFNHPAKIGDTISVFDKEFPVEGRISDIGIFFTIIKTADGEIITIPNNVFIQKMVKRKVSG